MLTEKEAVRRGPAAVPGGELIFTVINQETTFCLSNLPVFQSLPGEERDRVLSEEKMGGAKLNVGVACSPHRAKSPSVKVQLSSVCSVLCGPRAEFNHQHPSCGLRSAVGKPSRSHGSQLDSPKTDGTGRRRQGFQKHPEQPRRCGSTV